VLDAAQHLHAAARDDDLSARRLRPAQARVADRGQLGYPPPAPFLARQHEGDVVVVRVEQQQEAVIAEPPAARVGVGQRVAVEEDAERLGEARLPVLVGHLGAVRPEPGDVGKLAAEDGLALEEPAPPEHRVLVAEGDQVGAEGEEVPVGVLPVEPGDLVVLAVGVVVAAL
jgi:hypothetical protein